MSWIGHVLQMFYVNISKLTILIQNQQHLTHWHSAVFTFWEWFSTYKRSIAFRDSLFETTMEKWCCPKALEAQGFWKRHSDVAIFHPWSYKNDPSSICLGFLLSLQPFSSLVAAWWASLSYESTLSQNRARWCILLSNLASLTLSTFGTRLLMNFSTYGCRFWNLWALKMTTSTNFWR